MKLVSYLHRRCAWANLSTATLIAILPVLVIFMFTQRTLVTGMLSGATKG